jgi:hypothetical protein
MQSRHAANVALVATVFLPSHANIFDFQGDADSTGGQLIKRQLVGKCVVLPTQTPPSSDKLALDGLNNVRKRIGFLCG